MKHVKLFESYVDEADIESIKQLDSILSDYSGTLPEQVDAHVNRLLLLVTENMESPTYGDQDNFDQIAENYTGFIQYLTKEQGIDLPKYYSAYAGVCDTAPFALSATSEIGKAFASDKDVRVNWQIDDAKELLTTLFKSKNESGFMYLPDAKKVCKNLSKLEKANVKESAYALVAFIMVTFHKLRPLIKEGDEQGSAFKGFYNTKKTGAPLSLGDKIKGLGTKAIGGIVAAGVGIAALGKMVLSADSFVTQGSDRTGCFRACLKMVGKPAPPHLGVKMAKEAGSGHVKLPTFDKGVKTIDKALAAGKPIIVGVDDKRGSVNFDQTTDHFVVIVGSGSDSNGSYYQFFDPGTSHVDKGTHEENRFYMDNEGLLSGTSTYNKNSKHYTVSWARPTA